MVAARGYTVPRVRHSRSCDDVSAHDDMSSYDGALAHDSMSSYGDMLARDDMFSYDEVGADGRVPCLWIGRGTCDLRWLDDMWCVNELC